MTGAFVFDWDGTAVRDRAEPARDLARLLSTVLLEVPCVVVTGTSLGVPRAQCLDWVEGPGRANLYVCANRGSEAFGFGPDGTPRALFRRMATAEENAALDRAADLFAARVAERGLRTRVVRDRVNRRKIDLIPLERWRAPPKRDLPALLEAVERRLRAAGWGDEGLAGLVGLARRCATEAGLAGARVTSDVKHVEIGLTDKSDSMRWLSRAVLRERGIPPADVVVAGDEFGAPGGAGGAGGSDALMRIPELEAARFVSVGPEPAGVPPWVVHLGGGPARFRALLEERVPRAEALLVGTLDPDPSWSLEQEGFDPGLERGVEALFTVANGALGARGSLSVPIPSSQTDLFVAGIYDRKASALPYSELELLDGGGRQDPYAELVSFPSPFELGLRVDGRDTTLETCEPPAFRRALDFRSGCLHETVRWRLERGRALTLRIARAALLSDPHLLVQEVEATAEGGPVRLLVEPRLLGGDLPAQHPHLTLLAREDEASPAVLETSLSRFRVAIGGRLWLDGAPARGAPGELELPPGTPSRLLRAIVVRTSRESVDPVASATASLRGLSVASLRASFEAHRREWGRFWRGADLRFSRHPELTEAQRFASFHLRATASEDPATGVGARALSGRAYEGHVFWDSEIFMFPFYLEVAPELARACLDYRHFTLGGARARAREMGCRGACYAWESTVTGTDVTPRELLLRSSGRVVPIYTGDQQIHVTAGVAHAVAAYWEATGDDEWMLAKGLEILVETARFWASRAVEREGRWHLTRVVGPDEYHHDVDDNAYTNWMARRNLSKAAELCRRAAGPRGEAWRKLASRLRVAPGELSDWERVAAAMYFPEPDESGVIEQFTGYFALRDVPPRSAEELKAPVDRLLQWETTNGEQLIKQADVLMIPFLFPDAFPREVLAACYRYYKPRTDHGSSLSPCVHAAVAARLGEWDDALRFWKLGLQLDLLDLMRNTALGVHPGDMAGTWQALVFHLLGLEDEANAPLRERFLRELGPVEMSWRGRDLRLEAGEGEARWRLKGRLNGRG